MWEPLLQLSGPTQRAGADHATQAQRLESRKHERHEQRFWRYLYAGRVSRDFPTFFGWSTTASWGFSLLKKVGKSGEEWDPGWGTITVCALTSARLRWWTLEEDWWEGLWGSGPPGPPWGDRQETVTQVLCSPARQHLKPWHQRHPSKKIASTPELKREVVKEERISR